MYKKTMWNLISRYSKKNFKICLPIPLGNWVFMVIFFANEIGIRSFGLLLSSWTRFGGFMILFARKKEPYNSGILTLKSNMNNKIHRNIRWLASVLSRGVFRGGLWLVVFGSGFGKPWAKATQKLHLRRNAAAARRTRRQGGVPFPNASFLLIPRRERGNFKRTLSRRPFSLSTWNFHKKPLKKLKLN